MVLAPLARRYDHLVCALEGCVWRDGALLDGAADALGAWRAAGKRVAFATGETSRSETELVRELWRLGIPASVEEVVTAGGALQHVLAERADWRTAYVIGSPSLWRHVEDAGKRIVNHTSFAERADVVVVAIHDGFGHEELQCAVRCASRGAAVLAATREGVRDHPDGPAPGDGAVVAAIEAASGVRAESVAPPEPRLLVTALERLGAEDHARVLVVGERAETEMAAALALGLDAALVAERRAFAVTTDDEPAPVATGASLAALLLS